MRIVQRKRKRDRERERHIYAHQTRTENTILLQKQQKTKRISDFKNTLHEKLKS